MANLDPTKKIARQVGWINKNVALQANLSYSDVVEPLSNIDITAAMKILKDLEENANMVADPTGYVVSAASHFAPNVGADPSLNSPKAAAVQHPAGTNGAGLGGAGGSDPTGKIGRQIGWLNRNLPLAAALGYDEVIESLSQLDISAAMSILKDVEKNVMNIHNPTAYVISAASRQGASGSPSHAYSSPRQHMASMQPTWGPPAQQGMGMGMGGDEFGKKIGYLNKTSTFKEPISYSDVIGPLTSIDQAQAHQIMEDLQRKANEINKPTGYILSAVQRVFQGLGKPLGGGGGGLRQGGLPQGRVPSLPMNSSLDPTGKIFRQVHWLNKNVQLSEALDFDKVVGALSSIDVTTAMSILKEVEGNFQDIGNPNDYVIASAESKYGGQLSGVDGQTSIQGLDPTGKISRQVQWLNKNVSMAMPLVFEEIVKSLSAMDITTALRCLKDVEAKAHEIENPNEYVNMTASSMADPNGVAAMESSKGMSVQRLDPTGKISRQVAWLNENVTLAQPIVFGDVAQALGSIDMKAAMKILKDVEEGSTTIMNPNAYIGAAASRLPKGGGPVMGAMGAMAGPVGAMDPTGKIGRQISWLNSNVTLVEPINFNDVVQKLSSIDIYAAMKILKDVEQNAATIKNPNGYIAAAAARVPAGMGTMAMGGKGYAVGGGKGMGGGMMVMGGKGLGMGMGMTAGMGMGMGGKKRTWTEEEAHPEESDESAKAISKQIGRMNHHCPMVEKLSYADVKMHLEAVGVENALKILKDLEQSAASVKSPTNYVVAAAKRMQSGESIPAKRPRIAY